MLLMARLTWMFATVNKAKSAADPEFEDFYPAAKKQEEGGRYTADELKTLKTLRSAT